VRAAVAIVLLTGALTACTLRGEEHARPGATSRIDSCVLRLLHAQTRAPLAREAARYVRKAYCEPFEEHGWIYVDGALSIAARTWLEAGARCATASGMAGEPTKTVPCEEVAGPGPRMLECALLHHVRRVEVQRYIRRLERETPVRCDDGTPVHQLGVAFGAPAPPGG
jgi:hypothetical protein